MVQVCSFCGARLFVPTGARVHTAPSPRTPDVRVVFADGEEIHRCELDVTLDTAGTGAGDRSLRAQHVGRA